MDALIDHYVVPYYLKMMRTNAPHPKLIAAVREAAASITASETEQLLLAQWRPRVMGAWYAAVRPRHEIGEALVESLRTCAGDLTAPPLITATVLVLGGDGQPALMTYASAAAKNSYLGAQGFVAAAIEEVSGSVPDRQPSEADRLQLQRMLDVGRSLLGG